MSTAFTRYVQVLAANEGDATKALHTPTLRTDFQVERIIKAAVAAGTTTDANWAASLSDYALMSSEFIELTNSASVVGQMRTRRAPFKARVPAVATQSEAAFVDEGVPKPAVELSLESLTLTPYKIALISALAEELVRFSTPNSQDAIELVLINGVKAGLDRHFLDPDFTASSGHPASVTNGITATTSTGSSAAQITADLVAMLGSLVLSGSNLQNAYVVAYPGTAVHLSTVLNTGGSRAFPDATVRGGSILGLPLLVSRSAQTEDSPQQRILAVVDADRVVVADDGTVTVDASRQASVQLLTNPATGAQSLVSLWQQNMVGLRLHRCISWASTDAARYMLVSY